MSVDIDAVLQEAFRDTGRLYEHLFKLSQERYEMRERIRCLEEENESVKLQLDSCQGALAEALQDIAELYASGEKMG